MPQVAPSSSLAVLPAFLYILSFAGIQSVYSTLSPPQAIFHATQSFHDVHAEGTPNFEVERPEISSGVTLGEVTREVDEAAVPTSFLEQEQTISDAPASLLQDSAIVADLPAREASPMGRRGAGAQPMGKVGAAGVGGVREEHEVQTDVGPAAETPRGGTLLKLSNTLRPLGQTDLQVSPKAQTSAEVLPEHLDPKPALDQVNQSQSQTSDKPPEHKPQGEGRSSEMDDLLVQQPSQLESHSRHKATFSSSAPGPGVVTLQGRTQPRSDSSPSAASKLFGKASAPLRQTDRAGEVVAEGQVSIEVNSQGNDSSPGSSNSQSQPISSGKSEAGLVHLQDTSPSMQHPQKQEDEEKEAAATKLQQTQQKHKLQHRASSQEANFQDLQQDAPKEQPHTESSLGEAWLEQQQQQQQQVSSQQQHLSESSSPAAKAAASDKKSSPAAGEASSLPATKPSLSRSALQPPAPSASTPSPSVVVVVMDDSGNRLPSSGFGPSSRLEIFNKEAESSAASSHQPLPGPRPTEKSEPPAEKSSDDSSSWLSYLNPRNRYMVLLLIAAGLVSLFGNACFAAGICISSALWHRHKLSPTRRHVESIPVSRAADIDRVLPADGGYDCMFSKPISSKKLIRIRAYVERPTGSSQLMAPLTKKTCVLYSSSVSRQLHDGMSPVPVAFSLASVNFIVSLADSPDTLIEVNGNDVSLFDMKAGRHVEKRNFNRVPDDWQDFISAHRTSPHLSATLRSDSSVLEFQECTLCVGAMVTLVGELHRSASGILSMKPWSGKEPEASHRRQPAEGWRTSWEDWSGTSASAMATGAADSLARTLVEGSEEVFGGSIGESPSSEVPIDDEEGGVRLDQVLVSDNPDLCRRSTFGCDDWTSCCGFWRRCASARTLLAGKEKGDD